MIYSSRVERSVSSSRDLLLRAWEGVLPSSFAAPVRRKVGFTLMPAHHFLSKRGGLAEAKKRSKSIQSRQARERVS